MGLYEGRGNLSKGLKDLMLRWTTLRGDWDDQVADHFEKTYLEPLAQYLKTGVAGMDHMAQILAKVDRDCK